MVIRKVKDHFMAKWRKRRGTRAKIVRYEHHKISSKSISQNALKVLKQLQQSGYSAYLVGGGVRDLLVQQEPKDFDVVTDANPEQIRKLFSRSRIIGRRFRLVHVYFRGEIIEVSTFRANVQSSDKISPSISVTTSQSDIRIQNNTYGTIEEDAWRRDFTVNALYYDGKTQNIIDYVEGMQDIQQQCIRMIGDPLQRFHEDPVRLLRAIRLAAKLNFSIDENIAKCLRELGHLLYHVPEARILDELTKLFFKGHAFITYQRLNEFGYFAILFPATELALHEAQDRIYFTFFELALKTTDYRYIHNMSLNPGFLLSIFLWPALQKEMQVSLEEKKQTLLVSQIRSVSHIILSKQNEIFLISRKVRKMIRSIWLLQYYLLKPKPHQVRRILQHRYFRAAIDFFVLRVEAGEPYQDLASWWQELRTADQATCNKLIENLNESHE